MKRCTTICLSLLLTPPLWATDWPQWMGPNRDNVWRESGILQRFPAGGPKIVWRTPVAGGYAGPSVGMGLVFVTDYIAVGEVKVSNFERKSYTGQERVQCLDAATGKVKWEHTYPVEYSISYPAGPRCTPLVNEGRVYTLGAEGHLRCFDAATGAVVWSHDLKEQYGTKAALWGYAAHPLIDGDKLICVVGGQGSHVVALQKFTGVELWRSLSSPEQGYSPPTIIEAGGRRQLILIRPDALTSVDPENGRPFWSVPYEATNGSIIMSPVQYGGYLYAAGYSDRSLLVNLTADPPGATEVWRDRRRQAISPVNVQPMIQGNVLYGVGQNGWLTAMELPSGKRLWQTAWPLGERPMRTGTSFLIKQADRFWLFTEQGELIIATLTPEGHHEIDRAKILEPTNTAFGRSVVWCAPAFAGRRMYVRNDRECVCVDLAAPGATKVQ